MRTLIWGKTFVRAFKRVIKKYPHLRADIEETLELLAENPLTKALVTHKLKGKLSDSWACSVGYDMKIADCDSKRRVNAIKLSFGVQTFRFGSF